MFSTIQKMYFYTKTAAVATYTSVKGTLTALANPGDREKFMTAYFTVATAAVGMIDIIYGQGLTFLSGGLVSAGLIPTVFEARKNYVGLLAQEKTKDITAERKAELEKTLIMKTPPDPREIEKIRMEISTYLKGKYKINRPDFFRVMTKDKARQFYILGTHHHVPFENLPEFVKSKVNQLLVAPDAFMAKESLQENNSLDIFFILKLTKYFISISILKGVVCPWYLNPETDKELAYIVNKGMEHFEKRSPAWGSILNFLAGFMPPGAWLSFAMIDALFNISRPQVFQSEGIDGTCERIRRCVPLTCHGLETIKEVFHAYGLDRVAKLNPNEVKRILDIVLPKAQDQVNPIGELEDIRKDAYQTLETYSNGIVGQLVDADVKKKGDVENKKRNEEDQSDQLEKFGFFLDGSRVSINSRNINWLPKLKRLLSQYNKGLIVIGAGHLGNEIGLLNLLFHEGYEIERMTGENRFEPERSLKDLHDKQVTLDFDTYASLMTPQTALVYNFDRMRGRGSCCKVKPESDEVSITSNGLVKIKKAKAD